MISVSGRGENELLVQTDDDVREPANRRGVITFQ
jgi:OOP family OmpA-OmpF porin